MKDSKSQKGFTLIELVIVIVILAILAAIAIPRYLQVRSEAVKSALLGVEASMQSALALVRAQAKLDGLQRGAYGWTVNLERGLGGPPVTITLTKELAPIAWDSGAEIGMAEAIDLRNSNTPGGLVAGPFYAFNWPAVGLRSVYYYMGDFATCRTVYTENWSTGVVSISTIVSGC